MRYGPRVGRSAAARYAIDESASGLLIEARSTVGAIELATSALNGEAELVMDDGELADVPSAQVQLAVESLTSGNALYDGEIYRRLDSQRYPTIRAELRGATRKATDEWVLEGDLTIHGTTRTMATAARTEITGSGRVAVYGEQVIDIRDFAISLPRTLMLRIYPDVLVHFRIEVVREGED